MDSVEPTLSDRFQNLIARTARFLCREGRFGSWGTTRTSGTAIWALSDCGLTVTQTDFILYCLRQLAEADDCITDDRGMRFNDEVWDTGVALIALQRGAPDEFSPEKHAITKWLRAEAQADNFKDDPWETLWGLQAILEADPDLGDIAPFLKRCVLWVLGRRNSEGVLISPHYMGFLLSVLNLVVRRLELSEDENRVCTEAINTCETFLKEEFNARKGRGMLWANEPWLVGHILLGIAGAPNSGHLFFRDPEFNEFVVRWYEELEWLPTEGGWVDLVDTSSTLVGLVNYYRERESEIRGGHPSVAVEVTRQLTSRIDFRFEAQTPRRMTVHPIWRARKFNAVRNMCFVLMPFRAPWSDRIYRILGELVRDCGLSIKRADEVFRPDIMEDVWCGLNECRIVIAECTGRNPNVFYELGIAHTLGKGVIMLTQKATDIPSDLRRFRYIQYEDNDDGYRRLKELLPHHIDALLKGG